MFTTPPDDTAPAKGEGHLEQLFFKTRSAIITGDMEHDIIKFVRPWVRALNPGEAAGVGAPIFLGAATEDS